MREITWHFSALVNARVRARAVLSRLSAELRAQSPPVQMRAPCRHPGCIPGSDWCATCGYPPWNLQAALSPKYALRASLQEVHHVPLPGSARDADDAAASLQRSPPGRTCSLLRTRQDACTRPPPCPAMAPCDEVDSLLLGRDLQAVYLLKGASPCNLMLTEGCRYTLGTLVALMPESPHRLRELLQMIDCPGLGIFNRVHPAVHWVLEHAKHLRWEGPPPLHVPVVQRLAEARASAPVRGAECGDATTPSQTSPVPPPAWRTRRSKRGAAWRLPRGLLRSVLRHVSMNPGYGRAADDPSTAPGRQDPSQPQARNMSASPILIANVSGQPRATFDAASNPSASIGAPENSSRGDSSSAARYSQDVPLRRRVKAHHEANSDSDDAGSELSSPRSSDSPPHRASKLLARSGRGSDLLPTSEGRACKVGDAAHSGDTAFYAPSVPCAPGVRKCASACAPDRHDTP